MNFIKEIHNISKKNQVNKKKLTFFKKKLNLKEIVPFTLVPSIKLAPYGTCRKAPIGFLKRIKKFIWKSGRWHQWLSPNRWKKPAASLRHPIRSWVLSIAVVNIKDRIKEKPLTHKKLLTKKGLTRAVAKKATALFFWFKAGFRKWSFKILWLLKRNRSLQSGEGLNPYQLVKGQTLQNS